MKLCNSCHSENSITSNFCGKCGAPLPQQVNEVVGNNITVSIKSDFDYRQISLIIDEFLIMKGYIAFVKGDFYICFKNDPVKDTIWIEIPPKTIYKAIQNKLTLIEQLGFKNAVTNYRLKLPKDKGIKETLIKYMDTLYYQVFEISLWGYELESDIESILNQNFHSKVNLKQIEPQVNGQATKIDKKPLEAIKDEDKKVLIVLIILAVIAGYIYLSNSYSSSDSERSNSSSTANFYRINETTYIARTEKLFKDFSSYAYQNDKQAIQILINRGDIIMIQEGTIVTIVEAHLGYVEIRPRGSTETFWLVTDYLTKK